MTLAGPILLVGCGKMGGALLDGWLAHGLPPADVAVVEPDADTLERLRVNHGIFQGVVDPEQLPEGTVFRAVILAVKPQAMAKTLPTYRDLVGPETVVLSIAAGTPIATFAEAFGDQVAIVRAMPNTPAAIRRGASALVANPIASEAQRGLCESLMTAVGAVHWIDDEAQMHAITAMSGGGPAYVFLLIEALTQAGVANGLPKELARPLARETVVGSCLLAASSPDEPETLRKNVTSPGGTTEAALAVLMADDGLQPLLERAIAAGAARSQELARGTA